VRWCSVRSFNDSSLSSTAELIFALATGFAFYVIFQKHGCSHRGAYEQCLPKENKDAN
jgi:hypothetical protein